MFILYDVISWQKSWVEYQGHEFGTHNFIYDTQWCCIRSNTLRAIYFCNVREKRISTKELLFCLQYWYHLQVQWRSSNNTPCTCQWLLYNLYIYVHSQTLTGSSRGMNNGHTMWYKKGLQTIAVVK